MKIKNSILILLSSIIFSNCMLIELYQGFERIENFKPYTHTYDDPHIYTHIYGVLDGKDVNKFNVSKNDIYSVNKKVQELYGIKFERVNKITAISAHEGSNIEYYYIKFYQDFILKINGKEYIIPRTQIKVEEYLPPEENLPRSEHKSISYDFNPLPIDTASKNIQEAIIDIGEIEIIDKNGKIIRKKQKVPPLLFKRVRYRERLEHWGGYGKIYYKGWLENYHEYDESKEKEIEENQDKKEK